MGRAKLAMEYMKNDRARKTTFLKLKKSLKKKAQELATLCDVPVCVVIYQSPGSDPDVFPESPDHLRSIIDRYLAVPAAESSKRSLNLRSVLGNMGGEPQLVNQIGNWAPPLDGLCKEELLELASVLEGKLRAAEERIHGLRMIDQQPMQCPYYTGGLNDLYLQGCML